MTRTCVVTVENDIYRAIESLSELRRQLDNDGRTVTFSMKDGTTIVMPKLRIDRVEERP